MVDRVPVTLLAGFLGSGKTTLVNRILSAQHGQRLAVIVNEFGEVNIDGRLVVGVQDDVIELSNGCICCTVRGDLATTLHTLLRRRRRLVWRSTRFDRVLIEASGLASPGPAVQTLCLDTLLEAHLRLDAVITLAHAGHIEAQLHEHPEASEQVAYADTMVLNHCDRAAPEVLETATAALRACNPQAELMRATHARVDIATLLARRAWDAATWRWKQEERVAAAPHTCGVGALTLRTTRPLDLRRLQTWLQFLLRRRTYDIMRIKGLLRCLPHEGTLVVQGVYQWFDLQPGGSEAPAASVLVVIGRHLDRAEIDRGWTACQVGG